MYVLPLLLLSIMPIDNHAHQSYILEFSVMEVTQTTFVDITQEPNVL